MPDLEQVCDDLNLLASFLARRGVAYPAASKADVVVVMGNSLPVSVEVAAQAAMALGAILVCSGGVGHSTEDLRKVCGPGETEAELMARLAQQAGLPEEKILLEDRSTNSGENALLTRQTLERHGIHPRRLLIVQDPTMQMRAHATFQRVYDDSPDLQLFSYAPFVPYVEPGQDGPELKNDIPHLWPVERFISLVLGEVPRLTDYGPRKKGFIAHVEVPQLVLQAHRRLAERYPSLIR